MNSMGVYCNLCGNCCSLIPVKNDGKILVRDGLQIPDEEFFSKLSQITDSEAKAIDEEYVENIKNLFPDACFYKCNYLTADKKCFVENDKPSFCKNYPSSPLAFVPEGCGYTGEIFIKNEELKRKIRMIKEELLDYQSLIDSGDKDSRSYQKIIDNLSRFIKKYEDFGSKDW